MKTLLIGMLLASAGTAQAHRLDEYLQATTITLEKGRVQAQLRLTPGVAVLPAVMTVLDTDRDGTISKREQRAYARRVLQDLSLTLDGNPLPLHLAAVRFPSPEAMQEGLGEIQIDFGADTPTGRTERTLIFDNRHQRALASYLVNALVPVDPDIAIQAQSRDYQQSHYELLYEERGARQSNWPHDGGSLFAFAGVALLARVALLWKDRGGGK